ncbi:hypothetical protein KNSL1_013409 [Colletotrichum chrysophilum]|nr:hypothetical protein KNSL1_013409 [Colletotrichum chrysophilum]
MGDANLLKPVEALVLPAPSSDQRLSSPANKAAVDAEPFTYDDAVALHCQIEFFQRSYQKEGYKVSDNAERERRRGLTSQEEWWMAARQEQEDAEYDADADDEGSSGVSQPLRWKTNEMKERATLYRAVKQEMRRRGDLLIKNEESDNAVARRRSNFSLPEHVKTKDDLLVYLNQLGLRYTPRTATQRRRSRLRMLVAP